MDPDTLFPSIPDTSFAMDTSWLSVADTQAVGQLQPHSWVAMVWTYAAVGVVVLIFSLLALAKGWNDDEAAS